MPTQSWRGKPAVIRIYHALTLNGYSNFIKAVKRQRNLGLIILILSQPVFALSPECCVLSGEATNTNFKVFGLTRPGLESTIYRTRGEHANHYATDAVSIKDKGFLPYKY